MRFTIILFFLWVFSGCHMAGYYANKRIRHHPQTATEAVKHDSVFTVIKKVQPNVQQPLIVHKEINPVQPISTAPVQKKHSPTRVLKKTGRETTTIKNKTPFLLKHKRPAHRRKSHPLLAIGMILLFLLILFVFVVMLYVGATLIYTSAMSKTLMTFLFLVWAVLCGVIGRFLLHVWFKLLRGISHRVN